MLVGVDKVFEPDLKLLKAVLEVYTLFFDLSHSETGLLGFFLKRLKFFLGQIIEILSVNGSRTVD